MSPLRVLAVISSSQIGGAERTLVTILKEIDRRRLEMSVVCPDDGPMVGEYRRHAAAVWTTALDRVFDPRLVTRLAAIMREAGAEIVTTRLWNADVLGVLAARRAGVPLSVATVVGAYYHPAGESGRMALRRAVLRFGYRAVYRWFDHVIVGPSAVRRDLVERPGIRVDPRKVTSIPTGFDLGRVTVARSLPRPTGGPEPRIITVANLVPMKGHDCLLRALRQVVAARPRARCLLVGDGPLRPELEALSRRLGLADRVVFAGHVADPLPLVRGSDLFVLPSVAAEGFPVALFEALALGTPVVATRVGGIPEIVDDGRTAWLVAPGDHEALARAILEALDDPALAERQARAGEAHVRAHWGATSKARSLEALYLDLARGKGLR